jgi:exoribonuclease-2
MVSGKAPVVTLDGHGQINYFMSNDVTFAYPSFVDKELVAQAGPHTIIPENEMQAEARIEITKRLREVVTAIEKRKPRLLAHADRLHKSLVSNDPDAWAEVSVKDASVLFWGKNAARPGSRGFYHMLAVHQFMMDDGLRYMAADSEDRSTQKFLVRPTNHILLFEEVSEWIRRSHKSFEDFATKARSIIETSRTLAKESRGSPPKRESTAMPDFTESDLKYIAFVQHSLLRRRFYQRDPYAPIMPALIKKVGCYEGDVTSSILYKFIQEIGVIPPWSERSAAYIGTLRRSLPLGPVGESAEEKYADAHASQLLKYFPLRPDTDILPCADGLDSVRHDFDQLPVYTVDDAGAEELDDGISIEPIAGSPGCHWLHVHVADPTSLIRYGDPLAIVAEHRNSSVYLPHRTWPMIPTQVALSRFSLGASMKAGRPQPVLTFSAKIDGDGEIVGHKVTAGYVRNIQVVTYDDVNRALGHQVALPSYPFGDPPPMSEVIAPTISVDHQENLHTLQEVASRIRQRRLATPSLNWSVSTCDIKVSPKPLPWAPSSPTRPILYSGFPSLHFSVNSTAQTEAQLIIEVCMITAGKVAARFCQENGVPILYRTGGPPEGGGGSDQSLADVLATRDPITGISDVYTALRSGLVLPSAEYSVTPGNHWAMGIVDDIGYSRVTSPLRRYSDMICHWQIKQKLLPLNSQPSYPFSTEALQDVTSELTFREASIRRGDKGSRSGWALTFIQRWMEEGRTVDGKDPLNPVEARVTRPALWDIIQSAWMTDVNLPSLGISAILRSSTRPSEEIGDSIVVRATGVGGNHSPILFVERV